MSGLLPLFKTMIRWTQFKPSSNRRQAKRFDRFRRTSLRCFLLAIQRSASEALDRYYPADPEMWAVAFQTNSTVTPDLGKMYDFLTREIGKGVDPAVYSVAAKGITNGLALVNLDEAVSVVDALPDPKVKEECAGALVKIWKNSDPLSASDYVAKLPVGAGRDAAIAAVLPALSFAPKVRERLLSLVASDHVRESFRVQFETPVAASP